MADVSPPSSVAARAALRWQDAGNRIPVKQAYDLRDLAALLAMQLDSVPATSLQEQALRAQALRNFSTVWTDACDRIRILRGRPLPGSLRPERKPKTRPKPASPLVMPAMPQPDSKSA